MKYKKSLIFICLILCLFSIASICASEVNETVIEENDEAINQLEINEHTESSNVNNDWNLTISESQSTNNILKNNENSKVLTTEYAVNGDIFNDINDNLTTSNNEITPTGHTFSHIQNAISSASEGSTIILSGYYYQTNEYGNNWISINKNNLTIIGTDNCTLDVKDMSTLIFVVDKNNVTIKNINCINTKNSPLIWNGINGVIVNCTFTRCDNIDWRSYADNGRVVNCTFTNLGAIQWSSINGAIVNCTFTSLKGIEWRNSNGSIVNCTFTDSTSGAGGAIRWRGSNGSVVNCTFTNNTATFVESIGGAIYWTGANGVVSNCIFTNNIAYKDGGAIYWNVPGGSVVNCTFTNNTATSFEYGYGNGGAIYWNDKNGRVINCTFTNNTATSFEYDYGNGGAIYWNNQNGSVVNCTFTNNTATSFEYDYGNGGAIYWNKGPGSVVNCTFTNNIAYYDGGAIYWYNGFGSIVNCTFTGNTATDNGGAIYWNVIGGNVVNCTFTSNTPNNLVGIKNKPSYIITLNNPNPKAGNIVEIIITDNSLVSYNVLINNQIQTVENNIVKYKFNEAGTYTIMVFNIEDDTNLAVNKIITVTVTKIIPVITASPVTAVYNGNKNLIITVKDNQGNPVSGVKVTVTLNSAKTYTTGKNGQIIVSTNGLVPKTYNAKIIVNNDATYSQSTSSVKITVNKATPTITAKSKTFKVKTKTKKYTITLKNNIKKPIKNIKVTLKVNGKTYTAKTNTKGLATFKITKLNKKGKFTANIKYTGNNCYNAKSVVSKIIVK